MAKSFQLKARGVQDLINIYGALTPKEIATIKQDEAVKSISRVQRIFEELEKANDTFVKLSEKYNEPLLKLQQEYQEKIQNFRADSKLEEKEKEKEINKLVVEANSKIQKITKEQEKKLNYEKAGEAMVTVTINSDERFKLFQDIFEKVAAEKFLNKKALCDCWEAIEAAKEV